MGTRGSFRGGASPLQSGTVTGWLRLAASAVSAGEYTNWVDVLNPANPGVINAARRPATAVAANGLPLAAFLTNDCVAWPIAATNFNRDTFGIYLDVQPTAAAGVQVLWCIGPGTNGSNHRAIVTYFNGTGWTIDVYSTDANGRSFTVSGGAAAGARRRYGIEYDSSAGGDACLTATINGAIQSTVISNLGAGATLGQFQVCTGNLLIGNFNDGTASSQLGGNTGPNFLALTSKQPGAASGQLLTTDARAALCAFEVPT